MSIKSKLILFLLVISIDAGAQAKSDRETANLFGPVKLLRESFDRYGDGRLEPRDTVTYNPSGMEVERIMVSDYGQTFGKRTSTFDDAGVRKKIVELDETGRLRGDTIYIYSSGKLVEIYNRNASGFLLLKTFRTYNNEGKLGEEAYEGPMSEPGKTVFSYNAAGKLREVVFFLRTGEKANGSVGPCLGGHRVTHEYDTKGRLVKRLVFDVDGSVKKIWSYAYDDSGNMNLYVVQSDSSITSAVYVYRYDGQGNWTRRTAVIDFSGRLMDVQRAMKEALKPKAQNSGDISKKREITHRVISYY